MKKYLVLGKPIDHSLSPLLHNYWIKKCKIMLYMKKEIEKNDIELVIEEIRKKFKVLMLQCLIKNLLFLT